MLRAAWSRVLLALIIPGCTAEKRASDSTVARRAPADTAPRTSSGPVAPGSPWPADTHDVSIGHFSFEVPAQRQKVPRCSERVPLVTPDSVGPMHAGQTLAELRRACPELLFGWYYTDDQLWAPVAAARLGDGVALAVLDGTAPDARVSLVAALDSTMRTPEGIGARSRLQAARHAYGDPQLVQRKCAVFVRWPNRPGITARLLLPDETGWECSAMRKLAHDNDLRKVPLDTRLGYVAQELPVK